MPYPDDLNLALNTVVQHAPGGAHAEVYKGVMAQQSSGVNQVAEHAGLRHRLCKERRCDSGIHAPHASSIGSFDV